MPITEVFPKPTVKQVIFQIRFPNLFFIESRIGDIQIAIMQKFPESSMLFRRQFIWADLGPSGKIEDVQDKVNPEQTRKVWQFNSPLGYQLNILTDSLDITSQLHKTYDNPQSDNRFKDIIEYVLAPFFKITQVPIIGRVGLRYIDECPFPAKTTESFRSHFNSCYDTGRFPIESATEMQYKVVAKRGDFNIRYVETLNQQEATPILTLDFDGFALNVPSAECINTTDSLHRLIAEEYERTIKGPVYAYMREVENK